MKDSGLPVGLVNLFEIDRESASCELGVVVGEKRLWGKGIATSAVRLAAAHAFRNIGIATLFCNILPENRASVRLFETCGFMYQEAVSKDDVVFLRYRLPRPANCGESPSRHLP
jgi:RimJ/RimL family protein N-acetyltransferase